MSAYYSSRKRNSSYGYEPPLEGLVTGYSANTSSDLYTNSSSLKSDHESHTSPVSGCRYCNVPQVNIPRI